MHRNQQRCSFKKSLWRYRRNVLEAKGRESFSREESPVFTAAEGSGKLRIESWSLGSAAWRSLVALTRAMSVGWCQERVGKFIVVTTCPKMLPENEMSSVYVYLWICVEMGKHVWIQFKQHLLSVFYVLGTVMDAADTERNKTHCSESSRSSNLCRHMKHTQSICMAAYTQSAWTSFFPVW